MIEEKKLDIQKYVSDEITELRKNLKDDSKYKRNQHPDSTITIDVLKEGEI